MNRSIIRRVAGMFLAWGTLFIAIAVTNGEEYSAEQQKALNALRDSLAARSFGELAAQVAHAKSLAKDGDYAAEVVRLEVLAKYVQEFWAAVDQGARQGIAAGDIKVDDDRVAMVEYENGTLVIRHKGQNKRYSRATLPAKLALVLAQLHLRADVASNRVFLGAFLAMDGKGDRRLAAQHWEAAAKAGVDVSALLPELKVAPPKAPIVLPELTPVQQAVLNPAQWLRLTAQGNRWEREPLGKQASQNAEGRLVMKETEADEAVLAFKTRFMGDFQCRVIVQGVEPGQRFGLFPGTAGDSPILVDLPEGTCKIEFQRKGNAYTCRINDEEVVVELPRKAGGRLQGYVGVTLIKDKTLVVGVLEYAGR